jgi:hypothetical protein
MFYEMSTWDLLGKTPWKRSTTGHLEETFAGQVNIFALITTTLDPGATFSSPYVEEASANALAVVEGANRTKVLDFSAASMVEIPNLIPDG